MSHLPPPILLEGGVSQSKQVILNRSRCFSTERDVERCAAAAQTGAGPAANGAPQKWGPKVTELRNAVDSSRRGLAVLDELLSVMDELFSLRRPVALQKDSKSQVVDLGAGELRFE